MTLRHEPIALGGAPPLLWTRPPPRAGAPHAPATIVLAHGAGAPMDSPFMNAFADGLAAAGIPVARFEFPYMRRRREAGRGGAPGAQPVLQATWAEVIAALDAGGVSRRALLIGGKSMGGRIASMVADDEGVLGLVCLGYPFHPAGRPAVQRVAHLKTLATPAQIVQGTRDALGSAADVAGYRLARTIRVHWIADGDHNLKPRKSSGRGEADAWAEAIAAVAAFAHEVATTPRSL